VANVSSILKRKIVIYIMYRFEERMQKPRQRYFLPPMDKYRELGMELALVVWFQWISIESWVWNWL